MSRGFDEFCIEASIYVFDYMESSAGLEPATHS